MTKMFNAVLPENIGRSRDWDRGTQPHIRLPEATISRLRADLVRQLGSQRKADDARAKRVARKATYQHSTKLAPSTGHHYLTEPELKIWYARLDKCLGKKVKIP